MSGRRDNLTPSQLASLKQLWSKLIAYFPSSIASLPFPTGCDWSELFLSFASEHPDAFMLRFLRATEFDVQEAYTRITEKLKWRQEFNVAQLLYEGESALPLELLKCGKSYYRGLDAKKRPIAYIHTSKHGGENDQEATQKLTILMIETFRLFASEEVDQRTLVFDMTGFSLFNMDHGFVSFFRTHLERFYPETLGKLYLYNPPYLFWGVWSIIKVLLNDVIKEKIQFVYKPEEVSSVIPKETLLKQLGGLDDYSYKFIPVAEREKVNEEEKQKAIEAYRKSSIEFYEVTKKWAEGESVEEEREKASKRLWNSFWTADVFLRARTVYHRNGELTVPPPMVL